MYSRCAALLLLALGISACATTTPPPQSSRAPAPILTEGLQQLARADSAGFQLLTEGGEVSFLTGVNVGSAIPGRLPAELKVDAATWRRWLPMIADTEMHAIRLYTLQPPSFYIELRDYNRANPDRPLYLVQGVWVLEELLNGSRDLFNQELLALTTNDIDDAVAAIHGDVLLPDRQGYASGDYTADVSPWLVSWAFGIELDPYVVQESDNINIGENYSGTYIRTTETASPTEAWLAQMMDRIAGVEASYGRTMPLTFSNWPTTDPLEHSTEPSPSEDLVGIDANNLVASDAWPGGIYASYHAYPYYPDFWRYEPGIADFLHEGQIDPYAGYLSKLRDHHAKAGLPVMILEFGVPSSLGSAHIGSLGRDQGGHNEAEAMAMNAELLRTQHELGLAGGFVFAWQDEWFKRTWNTKDTEIPAERRQLWQNPLTNESHFGLIAMDPGSNGAPIVIDGKDNDWKTENSQAILESSQAIREIRATHDESYLYLRLLLDEPGIWEDQEVAIGFDTVPGGNGGLLNASEIGAEADTMIVVGPGQQANAYVRASNDYNDLVLGRKLGFYDVYDADLLENSGVWRPQRLTVNRPIYVPLLDSEQPIEWFDLNPLFTGSSAPDSSDYDSRTLWAADGKVIEIRAPWAMIGISDPSSRMALVVSSDGTLSTVEVERLGISTAIGAAGEQSVGYSWEPWQSVTWSERAKTGLDLFVNAVRDINAN